MSSNKDMYDELGSLFFTTRQIVRATLPSDAADQGAWLRLETLRFIKDAGEPTMHELASFLRVRAPSATSLIAHLTAHGLVRRVGEPGDRRVTRLKLTKAGEAAFACHAKRSGAVMRDVFADLSKADVIALARILRKLRDTQAIRSRVRYLV